jgi:hypothetical protein
VAAGDAGSADYPFHDPRRPWDGHAHVDYPASDPLCLGCGGTLLQPTPTGVSEVVWHPGQNDGTGGGVSRVFPLPDYQVSAGVPTAANPIGPIMRGVPDVAGDASQESGYHVLCDGQFFPDPANQVPPVGGTSAVAPLWAGLIALLNQGLGRRLGFVNPQLYALSASGAFRDITSGNNGDYQAGAGWDACTGLGTPDGQKLLAALQNFPHPANGAAAKERRVQTKAPPGAPCGCEKRLRVLDRLLRVAELILRPYPDSIAPSGLSEMTETRASAVARRGARAVGEPPEDVLIDCLGRNIGPDDIAVDEPLGNTGVSGDALATCLNGNLGTHFRGSDFPPNRTLGAILDQIVHAI